MTLVHTPSPWKWHWRHDDGVTTSGSVFSEIRKGHAYAVAICPRYQAEEQWAADASLIAAAPELLEFAQLFERTIDYAINVSLTEGDEEGARMKTTTRNMVRAVISKATGGDR